MNPLLAFPDTSNAKPLLTEGGIRINGRGIKTIRPMALNHLHVRYNTVLRSLGAVERGDCVRADYYCESSVSYQILNTTNYYW